MLFVLLDINSIRSISNKNYSVKDKIPKQKTQQTSHFFQFPANFENQSFLSPFHYFPGRFNSSTPIYSYQFFYKVMKKSKEDWIRWGKEKKKSLVFYEQNVLDLTNFGALHPGGKKVLEPYMFQDVTQTLFTIYPHKKETTIMMLNKYILGENTSYERDKKASKENARSAIRDSRSKKRVCFSKTIVYNIEKKCIGGDKQSNSVQKIEKGEKTPIKPSYQRNKSKKSSRFDVSIKLISEAAAEEMKNAIKMEEKKKSQQLDINILAQELDEDSTISNMPVLRIRQMNKQRRVNQI